MNKYLRFVACGLFSKDLESFVGDKVAGWFIIEDL